MTWRIAKAIDRLRQQVNAKYPNRRKDSDGTIGDAAHSSRASDHNPNRAGVVTACDITHDPAHGCDAGVLADVLAASRDPRIKYIIWNRRILSSEVAPWTWRAYNGSNPHNKHVHVSVKASSALYDDARDWALPGVASAVSSAPAPPPERPTLKLGNTGDAVKVLQHLLKVEADGLFGPKTRSAVVAVQRRAKIAADGIVGPYTWAVLI